MKDGKINNFNIQHFSTGDGKGIRTTVFMGGCNLKCPWCHNPESLYGEPVWRSVDDVITDVMGDTEFYETSDGGVTISGGEPLCDNEGCLTLLREFKKNGLHTILDTALAVKGFNPDEYTGLVDCFFVDVKTADENKFGKICGGNLETFRQNLDNLSKTNAEIIFRIPLIPNFNTDETSIDGIIELIKPYGKEITLLSFHRLAGAKYRELSIPYKWADTAPPEREEIEKIKKKFIAINILEADI